MPGKILVKQRLDVAEELSPLEECVADESDVVARLQIERQRCCDWRGGGRARRRLLVDSILCEFGIAGLWRVAGRCVAGVCVVGFRSRYGLAFLGFLLGVCCADRNRDNCDEKSYALSHIGSSHGWVSHAEAQRRGEALSNRRDR